MLDSRVHADPGEPRALGALPLASVEVDFACDSTGFGTCSYARWYDRRAGGREQKKAVWVKVHAMCGVKTNVIAAVAVLDQNSADSPTARTGQAGGRLRLRRPRGQR
ncbi:MAG: hypothetical protein U0797_16245 [Gemmataceae bacterium]